MNNRIGLARFVLASGVLVSHSWTLTLGPGIEPVHSFTRQQLTLGSLCVNGFFLLSGFLIAQSWQRSDASSFLLKRILRVYPAFIVAVLFTAVVTVAASEPRAAIASAWHSVDSGLRTVLFLGNRWPDPSGAFLNNPMRGVVNGSLWTIQPEFACYLLLAGFGTVGVLTTRWVSLATAFLLVVHTVAGLHLGPEYLTYSYLRLVTYFAVGVWAAISVVAVPSGWQASLALLVSLAAALVPPALTIVGPLTFGVVIHYLVMQPATTISRWCDTTDLSYGLYLYAFPIQQLLVAAGVDRPWLLIVTAGPVTALIAWFSWTAIERPAKSWRPATAPELTQPARMAPSSSVQVP